jgi:hypothetical protein
LEAATALFKRYVALEQSFDPAVADLYADDAKIQNTRRYPSGEVKVMSLPAAKYKALLRSVMPAAKARGDRNSYSDVKYTTESDGIRVSAKRYSELKKYTSPLSILVKPTAGPMESGRFTHRHLPIPWMCYRGRWRRSWRF